MIRIIQKITILALFCLMALLPTGCNDAEQAESLDQMLDGSLIDAQEQPENRGDSTYLLLYFSAHWCPPCQAFTPKLVDFYNTKGGGQLFQVVFISSDHNHDAMLKYMQEANMPWPAIDFKNPTSRKLQDRYSGDGIPRLVLVTPAGDILADSFKGREYLGPQTVLDHLDELVVSATRAPAEEEPAVSNKILPTPVQLARRYNISGFGRGSGQNIAIINRQFVYIGEDLGEGVVVDNITETYVEIIHDRKRYRLTQ